MALASFAIGAGVFVVAGLLGNVAREFSVPLETAGLMATVYAVAYAFLSPVLVAAVKGSTSSGRLSSRLAVVWRPAVPVTLAVTVLGMAAAFSVLTYLQPLLEDLAGFGAGGIASILLLRLRRY